uniref:Uncharacterized protein n=1 Tax=Sphaerodactylus townsendi TaxID=933632 RepID=A0ACB8G7L5_9SAUR
MDGQEAEPDVNVCRRRRKLIRLERQTEVTSGLSQVHKKNKTNADLQNRPSRNPAKEKLSTATVNVSTANKNCSRCLNNNNGLRESRA